MRTIINHPKSKPVDAESACLDKQPAIKMVDRHRDSSRPIETLRLVDSTGPDVRQRRELVNSSRKRLS